jgi:hypothetical protein
MRVQRRPQPGNGLGRTTRTATQARQGDIILGPRARWIWIGAFAVLIIVALYLMTVRG